MTVDLTARRRHHGCRGNVPSIPLAPFQRILEQEIAQANAGLPRWYQRGCLLVAQRAGVTERTVYRWRNGLTETRIGKRRTMISVTDWAQTPIEDALWRLGYRFEDVYPEFAEDVQLEPDMWCPTCFDMVTPVYGICPWCESVCRDDAGARAA